MELPKSDTGNGGRYPGGVINTSLGLIGMLAPPDCAVPTSQPTECRRNCWRQVAVQRQHRAKQILRYGAGNDHPATVNGSSTGRLTTGKGAAALTGVAIPLCIR